jgi:hypothetical protein
MLLRNFRHQLPAVAYKRPKRAALRNSLSTVAAMLPGIAVPLWRTRSISTAVHSATFLPADNRALTRFPVACLCSAAG